MAEQTNLPSIPPPNENNLVAFARAVKEALEVRLGRRGQALDAMVTFRDLDKVQMVLGDGRGGVAGLKPPAAIGTVGGSYDPTTDTMPPPAPQNVKASGAVRNIIIEWNTPPSTYRNPAYTEIWRAAVNNRNEAAKVGQSGSTLYVDSVGEGQTCYYWLRFVSQANVIGPWSAAADAGAPASTGLDVNYTLSLIEGQIRETHLHEALGERIDLIDGSGVGSVNARITTEAQARADADGALTQQITTVSSTVSGNTSAIQTQATAINGLSAQYTIKVQAGGITGGIGLAAEAPDGSEGMIDFAVRANRFYVAPPQGQGDTKKALFTHYTTPTTINGVQIPAGTYMDAAFMRTFVAQYGQIGALAVDDAAIANLSAAKLTAGDGTIGGVLKSAYYVSGAAGWAIHRDGWAEFSNATVRGTVYADTGWFKGQVIGGNATTYTSGTGMWTGVDSGTWKFRLGSNNTYMRWDGTSLTLRGTLTIEDSSGNVLLSSGSGIPWGSVSGKPDDPFNLCIKSSFEDGQLGGWSGNAVTVVTATTSFSSKALLTQGRDAVLDDWFSVTPGEQIEVTAAVWAEQANYFMQVGLRVVNPLGVTEAWIGAFYHPPGAGWAIKTGTITIPANASKAQCWVQIAGAENFGSALTTNLRYRRYTQITPSNVSTYIANAAIGNAQIASLSAEKINAGTINSDRIDTDLLAVKKFDNVTSRIINHLGVAVPLTRQGFSIKNTATSGAPGTAYCHTTITDCRTDGSFVAFMSGVLGDIQGMRVQYSVNGTDWIDSPNGPIVSWTSGAYRPYSYYYYGKLKFPEEVSTAYFRIYFSGNVNHTELQLIVLVDNTN